MDIAGEKQEIKALSDRLTEILRASDRYKRQPDGTYAYQATSTQEPTKNFQEMIKTLPPTDRSSGFREDFLMLNPRRKYVEQTVGKALEDLGFKTFSYLADGGHSISLLAKHENGQICVVKLAGGKTNEDVHLKRVGIPAVVKPMYDAIATEGNADEQRYGPIRLTIEPMALLLKPELFSSAAEYSKVTTQLQELIGHSLQVYNKRYKAQYGIDPMVYTEDLDNPDNIGLLPYSPDGGKTMLAVPVIIDAGHIKSAENAEEVESAHEATTRGHFPHIFAQLEANASGQPVVREDSAMRRIGGSTPIERELMQDMFDDIHWYDKSKGAPTYMEGVRVPKTLVERDLKKTEYSAVSPHTKDELLERMNEHSGSWQQGRSRVNGVV